MIVIFAALIATASAAKYCCMPDQWQSQVGLVMGIVSHGHTVLIEGSMNMTYDGVNRIMAFDQALFINGRPDYQRVVNDHRNNVMYVIKAGGCHRIQAAPWISNCIPDNATETTRNSRFGLGDNSVDVKAYTIQYEDFNMYVTVTADTCVPVTEILTGKLVAFSGLGDASTEAMEVLHFANITPGIPVDRAPFFIPEDCLPA